MNFIFAGVLSAQYFVFCKVKTVVKIVVGIFCDFHCGRREWPERVPVRASLSPDGRSLTFSRLHHGVSKSWFLSSHDAL